MKRCKCGWQNYGCCMTDRQQILSKLERVWDMNPDKSFCELLHRVLYDTDGPAEWVEDGWVTEALDEIIDEQENGECS